MSIVPIGIDLGTNNSCISFVDGDAIKCVPNPISKGNTHASVVYIPLDGGSVTVGQEAVNSGQTHPKQLIYCVKRLIGRVCVPETNNFAYNVESEDGQIIIKIPQNKGGELIYSPMDINAFILQYLRRSAELFFNPPDLDTPLRIYKTSEKAVITVPAAFNSEQRRITRRSAQLAGIDCLRILSEPTAAAMAYIYSHFHDPTFMQSKTETIDPDKAINLLMFDLGGGTFDVSIVSVAKEGFQVRSTSGNNAFGGEDIDSRIAEDIKRQYLRECGTKNIPNATFPMGDKTTRKLRKEAQKLKEKLSDQLSYTIDIDKDDWDLLFDFKWEYKRSRLDALLSREFERSCIPVVNDALNKANLVNTDIFQCVLVGGSTRIPYFRSSLEKLLQLPISRAINPDEAVSKGAAYLASFLVNKQLKQQQKDNSSSSTSLLNFTEVSLARGELSAFSYAIGLDDDPPACLISSGVELPSTGEHSFFLRHENPNDPLFDNSPLTFYVYEAQDRTSNNKVIEKPRKLFEVVVARQKVELQTISFYAKLDSDGVFDLFVVDEDEHYQIPNIDMPEIQALLQLQDEIRDSQPSTPSNNTSTGSQFSFGSNRQSVSTTFNTANPHAPPTQPLATPRRHSTAFATTKRLPVKIASNVKNASQLTSRPILSAPPPPRAPPFERLSDPIGINPAATIPPPPSMQPNVQQTLADKFYNGYANPEFVYMRQFRADEEQINWNPGTSPSYNSTTTPTTDTHSRPPSRGSVDNNNSPIFTQHQLPTQPQTQSTTISPPTLPSQYNRRGSNPFDKDPPLPQPPRLSAPIAPQTTTLSPPSTLPTTFPTRPSTTLPTPPQTLPSSIPPSTQQQHNDNPFIHPTDVMTGPRRDSNPFSLPTRPAPGSLPPPPTLSLPQTPQTPQSPPPAQLTIPQRPTTLPPTMKPPSTPPAMKPPVPK